MKIRKGHVVYVEGASAILGDVTQVDDDGRITVVWRKTETVEFNADDLVIDPSSVAREFDLTDLRRRVLECPDEDLVQVATEIRCALEGDSNDDEHDALAAAAEFLGIEYENDDEHDALAAAAESLRVAD